MHNPATNDAGISLPLNLASVIRVHGSLELGQHSHMWMKHACFIHSKGSADATCKRLLLDLPVQIGTAGHNCPPTFMRCNPRKWHLQVWKTHAKINI